MAGRSGAAAAVAVRVPLAGGGSQDYPAQVADGTFVAGDVPLPAVGVNDLVLVCTDTGGTESTVPHPVERLAAGDGPSIDLVSPADGAVLAADSVTASGTVTAAGHSYKVPDLVAPGEAIYSCDMDGGYDAWDGTSMATPIVSGIAALLLEEDPHITVTDLTEELMERCHDLGAPEDRQGRGLLRWEAAS